MPGALISGITTVEGCTTNKANCRMIFKYMRLRLKARISLILRMIAMKKETRN